MKEVKQGFTRQRRNLVLICLILLFVELGEVSFSRINILGNMLIIRNQNYVIYPLWIAFFYWLIRYFQYFNDISDKGIISSFFKKMDKLVPLSVIEKFKKEVDLGTIFPDFKETPIITLKNVEVKTRNKKFWVLNVHIDASINDGNGKFAHTSFSIGEQIVYEKDLRTPKIKSWLSIIFTTRLFSEYFLPFLIAIIPIVVKLWLICI